MPFLCSPVLPLVRLSLSSYLSLIYLFLFTDYIILSTLIYKLLYFQMPVLSIYSLSHLNIYLLLSTGFLLLFTCSSSSIYSYLFPSTRISVNLNLFTHYTTHPVHLDNDVSWAWCGYGTGHKRVALPLHLLQQARHIATEGHPEGTVGTLMTCTSLRTARSVFSNDIPSHIISFQMPKERLVEF